MVLLTSLELATLNQLRATENHKINQSEIINPETKSAFSRLRKKGLVKLKDGEWILVSEDK